MAHGEPRSHGFIYLKPLTSLSLLPSKCLLHAAGINSFAAQFGAASSEAQNAAAKELVISVQNNLSAAYLKQERWDSVITSATKVLSLSPEGDPNIKALYRRASAYYAKGDVVKAAQDLDVALAKAPTGAASLAPVLKPPRPQYELRADRRYY